MIIKKINNLALDIQKNPKRYWLNIMQQSKDGTHYWVISGFDYDKEYELYQLNSVGNRLNDKEINWNDYGELVKLGYEILNSNNKLEKIYNNEVEIIEEDKKIEKLENETEFYNYAEYEKRCDIDKVLYILKAINLTEEKIDNLNNKINELIDAVNGSKENYQKKFRR